MWGSSAQNGKAVLDNFSVQAMRLGHDSFLRNPVVKIIRTDDPISGIDGVVAGESALEEYSMIAAVGQCKAVGKDVKVSICQESGGINCIEKWMYDPGILAEDGICDKLSLILSMADNPDERIHKEIVKLKETVI